MGISPERFSELAQPVLREVDAADAGEARARKSATEDRKIDVDALAKQIKTLPFDKRSNLIDIAIDANADHLIGNSAPKQANGTYPMKRT